MFDKNIYISCTGQISKNNIFYGRWIKMHTVSFYMFVCLSLCLSVYDVVRPTLDLSRHIIINMSHFNFIFGTALLSRHITYFDKIAEVIICNIARHIVVEQMR